MLQSLLALLKGERAAEGVWTADISYWIAGQQQHGQADPAWKSEEGYLQLCRQLGTLPYYWYDRFWLGRPEYDSSIRVTVYVDGDTTFRTWHTPEGELREEQTFLPQSCSTAITRYPVQTGEDLRTLLCLLNHRRLIPDCLDDYLARRALWARYDGLPSIALPRSPLPAFLYEWAGVQDGIYLLMDYPDLLREVLGLLEQQEAPIVEAVCAAAPPLVHFADNLSSANLTSYYEPFIAQPHRRRLDRLHAAGVSCAVHLDGTLKGLLPRLAANGFDAIEAVTPQPAGDLDVEVLRACANNQRVILWGGIPGVMFAPPYAWSDMQAHVRRVLRAWRGTPFILGVADQVPPDGNIDFCRGIAEMIGEEH
jgi:hypothetical protein